MKNTHILVASTLVLAFVAGGYAAFEIGMRHGASMAASGTSAPTPTDAATQAASPAPTGAVPQGIAEGEDATRRHMAAGIQAGQTDPANGRRILYYHDPMVPGNKFDKPAKAPFMDMMLLPVYTKGDADQRKITVSSRIQQNLGVRTASVVEAILSPQVSAVGSIAYNERDQVIVQARATGYVERLHVRATLDRVAKGQALAAKHFYRPAEPDKVPAALLAQFPEVSQVTIDGAFGGWKKAQAEHFGDGGFFDRIYKP